MSEGTVVNINCDEGYTKEGSKNLTCQSPGNWDNYFQVWKKGKKYFKNMHDVTEEVSTKYQRCYCFLFIYFLRSLPLNCGYTLILTFDLKHMLSIEFQSKYYYLSHQDFNCLTFKQ